MAKSNGNSGSVGYKRPPAHGQFVKGKSGNPNGRPRGHGAGKIGNVVNQLVTVTIEGVSRKVPLTEALTISMAQRGLAGNIAAAREFIRIADKVVDEQKLEEARQTRFRIVPVVTDNWLEPLERLGIFEKINGDTYIQKWVVEAALARDPSIPFSEEERRLVLHSVDRPRKSFDP